MGPLHTRVDKRSASSFFGPARPTSWSRSGRGLDAKDADRDALVTVVGHHLRCRGPEDGVAYGSNRLQRHRNRKVVAFLTHMILPVALPSTLHSPLGPTQDREGQYFGL